MPPADRQQTGVLYLMQPAIILPPPANSGGAPLPTLRESGGCPRGSVRASCASAALVPFSSPAPRCALRLCSALSKRGGAGGCFLRITQTHTHCYTLHTHKVAQPIVCVCLCVKLKQQGESDVSPCFAHRARPDCAAGGSSGLHTGRSASEPQHIHPLGSDTSTSTTSVSNYGTPSLFGPLQDMFRTAGCTRPTP